MVQYRINTPSVPRAVAFLVQFTVHRCGSSVARVTYGKAMFCLRMVRWFSPGFSGFCPPLMNDRLDTSEIFLKEP